MLLGIKEIGWPEEGEGKAVSAEIASDTNPAQPHTHTTSPQSVLPTKLIRDINSATVIQSISFR